LSRLVLLEPFINGVRRDIVVEDGAIAEIGVGLARRGDHVIACRDRWLSPALLDMHVHLREPGQEHKEDIETGCRAAIAGGFGAVCCMPNTEPAPDNPEVVEYIHRRAAEVGRGVDVLVVGAAIVGNRGTTIADLAALKGAGCVMVSDDGYTIRDESVLRDVLVQCGEIGLPFSGHFELPGPDGLMSEPLAVERCCRLASETGAHVHVAHTTTKEAARIILEARRSGARVTWEVCPHHLTLTQEDIPRLGTLAKIAPRLKTAADATELLGYLAQGDVDALGSDHAPHTDAEKARPYDEAPSGMLGMECVFSVSHKALWDLVADPLAWQIAVEHWTDKPWAVIGRQGPKLEVGTDARLAAFEFGDYTVERSWLHSRSSNCPHIGRAVRARPYLTVLGRRAWLRDRAGRLVPVTGEAA